MEVWLMPDLPIFEPGDMEVMGVSGSTSYGAALARGTAANSKGGWSSLFTAANAIRHVSLTFSKYVISGTTSPIRFLVDLGISNTAYVSDILVQMNPRSHARTIELPITVPNGSTLQARMQAGTHGFTGPSLYVSGHAYSQGFACLPAYQDVHTYGVTTGTTSGTQIDPGGTADTKGSWTQITGSTSARHTLLILCVQADNGAMTDADWRIDLGVGGSGSETTIWSDRVVRATAGGDDIAPNYIPIPMVVPISTRLAVRAQCSITDATDRLFDCAILGLG